MAMQFIMGILAFMMTGFAAIASEASSKSNIAFTLSAEIAFLAAVTASSGVLLASYINSTTFRPPRIPPFLLIVHCEPNTSRHVGDLYCHRTLRLAM